MTASSVLFEKIWKLQEKRLQNPSSENTVAKSCLPIAMFLAYNQGKSGFLCPNNLINVKANTKSWVGVEILIAKSRPLDSIKRLVKWLSARCHTPKSRFRIPTPNFC
ncbi:hypothetical protein VNO77_37456 [Canavalia gladiata]|uniref:Uncharacterized protein n=1 Tax=Canavalia gladiata TaxID=3824 RepID=A0AAN9K8Y3_CANGL